MEGKGNIDIKTWEGDLRRLMSGDDFSSKELDIFESKIDITLKELNQHNNQLLEMKENYDSFKKQMIELKATVKFLKITK